MNIKDIETKVIVLLRVSSAQQLVTNGTLSIQRQIITEYIKEKQRKVMMYYEYQ